MSEEEKEVWVFPADDTREPEEIKATGQLDYPSMRTEKKEELTFAEEVKSDGQFDYKKPKETKPGMVTIVDSYSRKPIVTADYGGDVAQCVEFHKREMARADLRDIDFSNGKLEDSIFKNADLAGSNFEKANLRFSNFSEANVNRVNFDHADLRGASFQNCDLSRCSFVGADLRGADVRGARLPIDAALEGADLTNLIKTDEDYEDMLLEE